MWIGVIFSLFFIVLIFIDIYITNQAKNLTFSDVEKIKFNKVGLVLGTIKTLENGKSNLYFKYRMDAAESLFKNGKVRYLIVSGDNSQDNYNESEDMKHDLINRGISENNIFLDYAGFRTLDSIVRAKEIFGQSEFTIISQKFHNERALFIANHKNLKAIGFNAKDVSITSGLMVQLREYLARVKMIIDLYITHQKPKFLGEKIDIP